jgi:O-antigen/teichoic acid export membrane protein
MRVRRGSLVSAGVVDAGLASLASFGTSLYAARSLTAAELGAYALFFSAYLLAALVPTHLTLMPAQILTVDGTTRGQRLALLGQTWALGLPFAVAAAVAGSAAAYLLADAPADVRWALAVTMVACATISPLQDHARRTLHVARSSWTAASVSLIQLVAVLIVLAAMTAVAIPPIWRPFGALALGNAVSLLAAFLITRRERNRAELRRYHLSELVRSGRWLLVLELMPTLASFLAYALIAKAAGSSALGYAEAARIVAQPLYVLMMGLNYSLGPRSMEAGAARNREQAQRIAHPYIMVLLGTALLYGGITVVPWPGNPLGTLIPKAYVVIGLVPASVLAYLLLGLPSPYRFELFGSRKIRPLPLVGAVAGVCQCLASVSVVWIGPFARPVGSAVYGAIAWLGYARLRRDLYRQPSVEPEPAHGSTLGA